LLERNPEQRFHSASDLAFALEALSESGSVPAVAAAGAPDQRRRGKALLWSVAVVAILAIAKTSAKTRTDGNDPKENASV
jgi:eukaryotic-like serine/threonine-protein kinase